MILPALLMAVVPAFAQLSLSDAEVRAVAQNVDVQIARGTVRQRAAALEIARSGGIPHVTGNYALAPQAGPFDQNVVEQHMFTAAVGVTINDIFAASAQSRSAASDLIAAQRDAEAATLRARENAVKLYFGALQSIALERARQEALEGAQRDRSVAGIRVRNGAAPRLDVVRADVSVAQAESDLVRASADRANAVDALASATGSDPASFTAERVPEQTQAPDAAPDEKRAVTRALAGRPEVASLLAAIDARGAGVDAARGAGWPTATASGGYSAGVDSGQSVHGPAANVTLDIPLAPAGNARVSSALAELDVARAQLIDERRTVALEAAAAARDVRADREASTASARALTEALRAFGAVETGYREGASSSLDVADARRTLTQASIDALVAQYREAQSEALLEIIAP
ncbi:MAG TPA: TolC family protein [Candidatus Acidoferrales bacterium]|nr:TolC family protein [Candidatus Acidoferrales bacterium]